MEWSGIWIAIKSTVSAQTLRHWTTYYWILLKW
jgi:hypothetical protein